MSTPQTATALRAMIVPTVTVREHPNGLIFLDVDNQHATASICLQGAQVVHYQPQHKRPVLWVSDAVDYQPGTSIRGGIPVCWPWFGAHPSERKFPAHGFARTVIWHLRSVSNSETATQLAFSLLPDDIPQQYWPFATTVELIVSVGATLQLQLITHNNSSEPVTISQALHSYFAVDDINTVSVLGLDGCRYLDAVDDERPSRTQHGPVTFCGNVDSIFFDGGATLQIAERQQPHIAVSKQDSATCVVWNPWRTKAKMLSHFHDDDYLRMVCVEAANIEDDAVTIEPGGEHTLQMELRRLD